MYIDLCVLSERMSCMFQACYMHINLRWLEFKCYIYFPCMHAHTFTHLHAHTLAHGHRKHTHTYTFLYPYFSIPMLCPLSLLPPPPSSPPSSSLLLPPPSSSLLLSFPLFPSFLNSYPLLLPFLFSQAYTHTSCSPSSTYTEMWLRSEMSSHVRQDTLNLVSHCVMQLLVVRNCIVLTVSV